MAKGLRESLKLNKISKKKLTIFAMAVISIGIAGGVTFAKYYANNSNKGVTAAANYYFSSDVLDEAINKQDNPQAGQEEWKDVYNTDAWDGKSDYDFNLKIRNYENQLLYNSDNLDVKYKITFKLLSSDGGSYSVTHGSETKGLEVGKEISFDADGEDLVIEGGKANFDDFTVIFDAPESAAEEEKYQSPGIQVVAEITGPDFLAQTETKIGGVLHVTKVKAKYSLIGKYEFSLPSSANTQWQDGEKDVVNAMAAFPYSITYTPGEDNAAHDITISWDAEKLQLNQFDKHYSSVENVDGKSTLQVRIQPQETIKLVFYRTDDFKLEELSPKDFWELIKVEDQNVPTATD